MITLIFMKIDTHFLNFVEKKQLNNTQESDRQTISKKADSVDLHTSESELTK
jgi:hypothetical protein